MPREVRRAYVSGVIASAIGITVAACAGAVPERGARASAAVVRTETGERVTLSPAREAGWAGWCMSVAMEKSTESCANVRAHGPILAERWTSAGGRKVRGVVVASREVTAVSLSHGTEIETRDEAGLPAGLRVAVVEITDSSQRTAEAVAGGGFIPFGKGGVRIRKSDSREAPLGYEIRSEGWRAPMTPPRGLCAIGAVPNSGLHPVRGGVATEARSFPGIPGRAFVTCADTEYATGDGASSLLATMLVDASHPGRTPGPLPEMKRLPGRPGMFQSRAGGGVVVAKRIFGGGWLAVGSGPFTTGAGNINANVALLSRLTGAVRPSG
jgi:hypothetical protein